MWPLFMMHWSPYPWLQPQPPTIQNPPWSWPQLQPPCPYRQPASLCPAPLTIQEPPVLDKFKLGQIRPHYKWPNPPPEMLKLVHYVACNFGKRAVGIWVKCLLVSTVTQYVFPVRVEGIHLVCLLQSPIYYLCQQLFWWKRLILPCLHYFNF